MSLDRNSDGWNWANSGDGARTGGELGQERVAHPAAREVQGAADAHDPLRFVDRLPAHAEGCLNAVFLCGQDHRHAAATNTGRTGREAVDVRLLPVDAGGHSGRDEIGETDSEHVAARR